MVRLCVEQMDLLTRFDRFLRITDSERYLPFPESVGAPMSLFLLQAVDPVHGGEEASAPAARAG